MPNATPPAHPLVLTASDEPAHVADVEALIVFARQVGDGAATADEEAPGGDRRQDPPAAPELVLPTPTALPDQASAHLREALTTLRATGKAEEVIRVAAVPGLRAPLVAIVGLGKDSPQSSNAASQHNPGDPGDHGPLSADRLRQCAGAAIRALPGRPRVAILAPGNETPVLAALAEGAGLGAYHFAHHRGKPAAAHTIPPAQISLVVPANPGGSAVSADVTPALQRAEVLARAVRWARDLVNTGPNELYPQAFVDQVAHRVQSLPDPSRITLTVMDEVELREAGFGGITGVGQGSAHPARIAVVRYQPNDATAHLAYVGKGITFDSGGLCLKPATSMPTMKCDMAGAAAVAAAVLAAAELGVPVALTGILALAENMPSGTAQRPGDVVTMGDGTTVEIINTDAEGRLVLADGLCLAQRENPDAVVDIATLTGAAIVALGKRTAAVLANDDTWRTQVADAAADAGEPLWPLPITPEIRATMDSLVADLKHTGEPGSAGTIVGAAFLGEFAGKHPDGSVLPWAHLDIAGPAYNEAAAYGLTPKGGTGYGVRTLVRLAEARA